MKQKYTFFDGGTIEFDNRKSVKELIAYAFNTFDYYEPLGMNIVTLFQAHHPNTNTGWFTTDVTLSCEEEIKNPQELCFAYHWPNVFYFAEGGWGHHMPHLGNHPFIDQAVSLKLRIDGKDNTIVINGNYSFNDIIKTLKNTEYISFDIDRIKVLPVGIDDHYSISLSDRIMSLPLTDFLKEINFRSEKIQSEHDNFIYYEIFVIN